MALSRTYEDQECPIARALEVVGQRWTLLIVREALRGTHRFTDFKTQLGIAPNVLQSRLEFLVEMEILERRESRQRPHRVEYALTGRGRDLWPVLAALAEWSEAHLECGDWPPFALRPAPLKNIAAAASVEPELTFRTQTL